MLVYVGSQVFVWGIPGFFDQVGPSWRPGVRQTEAFLSHCEAVLIHTRVFAQGWSSGPRWQHPCLGLKNSGKTEPFSTQSDKSSHLFST